MWYEVVVDPDSFLEFQLCTFLIWQTISQIKLILESLVNSLSNSIFIGIMLFSHADINVVILKGFCVLRVAVLKAPVGVMYQRPVGVFTVFNSCFKCINAVNCLEII